MKWVTGGRGCSWAQTRRAQGLSEQSHRETTGLSCEERPASVSQEGLREQGGGQRSLTAPQTSGQEGLPAAELRARGVQLSGV